MAAVVVSTPTALYRHLLRRVALLPSNVQEYYKHRVKQVRQMLHKRDACSVLNYDISVCVSI